MSAGFTPAPWSVSSILDGRRYSIGTTLPCINGLSARFELAVVHAPDDAEIGYTEGAVNLFGAEANARLIAAAPELFAVVAEFVENYDLNNPMRTADCHRAECRCIRCVRDRGEAALAKARGQ